MARKTVRRESGATVVLKVVVATCTHVRPQPESVGVFVDPVATELITAARTRLLPAGVSEGVLELDAAELERPDVRLDSVIDGRIRALVWYAGNARARRGT